jgi:hypothetical protein
MDNGAGAVNKAHLLLFTNQLMSTEEESNTTQKE